MAKAFHQLPSRPPGVVCTNNILYEHAPLYPPWDWGWPHLKLIVDLYVDRLGIAMAGWDNALAPQEGGAGTQSHFRAAY